MKKEEIPKETPLQDLKNKALRDYQEAASHTHHYNSFIEMCIRAYQPKQSIPVAGVKTAEEVLFDVMTENNFSYVSVPAFIENESSVDVFDIAVKASEAYNNQFKDHAQFANREISDDEIEKWAEEQIEPLRGEDGLTTYELAERLMGLGDGAKAMRDGKLTQKQTKTE